MDTLSTRDAVRKAWQEVGEPAYQKVGSIPADSATARQVQLERWRDLVDWLDTAEGRAFLSAAFPEVSGYLYPVPSNAADARYQNHIVKCRAIVDGMHRDHGRWEVIEAGEIVVPRRSPLLFTLVGAVMGAALALGVVFLL